MRNSPDYHTQVLLPGHLWSMMVSEKLKELQRSIADTLLREHARVNEKVRPPVRAATAVAATRARRNAPPAQ